MSNSSNTKHSTLTKRIAFSGAAMALAIITSEFIPTFPMPLGGSATLFSMLFITLIGYWFGPVQGILCAVAYGLLQFAIDPKAYTMWQLVLDYPLAFGALGLSGFFYKKRFGLISGYLTGVLGRFVFATISGYIFYGSYAPEGTPAILYSMGYNATYIVPEAIITLLLCALPPVYKALARVKQSATGNFAS